jgi:hypothetical protein
VRGKGGVGEKGKEKRGREERGKERKKTREIKIQNGEEKEKWTKRGLSKLIL